MHPYGYNSNIHDPERMEQGVATDYTERRLLWIIRWVQEHYKTDPNRTYCTGSSMGGCGSMSFAFRHPEIFAAIRPHVPIVEYDKGAGGDSARRIDAECGPLDRLCSDGMPLRERLSATHFVKNTDADLPFVVITNGRKDGSIPWWKNPAFYRALDANRQAFVAAWDDGAHGTCGRQLPADVKQWNDLRHFRRFALNKSYLAFSHCSVNDDPGNGDPVPADCRERQPAHDRRRPIRPMALMSSKRPEPANPATRLPARQRTGREGASMHCAGGRGPEGPRHDVPEAGASAVGLDSGGNRGAGSNLSFSLARLGSRVCAERTPS